MPRIVRCSIIQASNAVPATEPLAAQKQAMIDKHLGLIRKAAADGAQIVCLQEIFNGPYFCAEQSTKWYETTEPVPDGPTVSADAGRWPKNCGIAMVVPVYEVEQEGIFYNTAAVIHNDGIVPGQVSQDAHSRTSRPASGRSSISGPATSAIRSSIWDSPRSASTSATTGIFPRARAASASMARRSSSIPRPPSPGLSEYLWKLEQPAHAAANGYFIAAINRVGTEPPWNIGEFYGSSYFANPRGQIVAQASRDKDEVLTADLNLDEIAEVRRTWQFFRDRRPDQYGPLVAS